jgi:hypothetical protein
MRLATTPPMKWEGSQVSGFATNGGLTPKQRRRRNKLRQQHAQQPRRRRNKLRQQHAQQPRLRQQHARQPAQSARPPAVSAPASCHPAPPRTGVLAASVAPGCSSQTPGAGGWGPCQEGGRYADPTCRMQQPECAQTATSPTCEHTLWNRQIRTRQAVRSRLATRPRPHHRSRLSRVELACRTPLLCCAG